MLLFFTITEYNIERATLRMQYDQICNIISQPECRYFYVLAIMQYNRNNQSSNYCQKKKFRRFYILIQDMSITLNEKAFFDFKNIFMIPISQDGRLVKGWDSSAK